MPKITQDGGPSFAGHVDVSSADTVTPEWAPADPAPEPEPVEVEVLRPSPRKRTRRSS